MERNNKTEKQVSRHSRRSLFPESNRFVGQLRILSRAMLPFLFARVSGAVWRARAAFFNVFSKLRSAAENSRSRIPAPVFLCAALLIASAAVFTSIFTLGTTVVYDGNELGTVPNQQAAASALGNVETELSGVLGEDFTLDMSLVSYSTGLVSRSSVVDETAIGTNLNDQLDLVTYGYSLYVNDDFIGATRNKSALSALLEQVKAPYMSEYTKEIDFVENVEIREGYLPNDAFCNLGDIVLKINETKAGEVVHIVEQGDTWSAIASEYNTDSDALERLNPGFDIDKLQIGDEILISNAVPYLTVQVSQWEYYEAEIPYDIEYVDDPDMWEGDTATVKKGVYGIADTTALVTYVNSEEVAREITAQTVISEPETAVVRRGTAKRPSWAPTGTFAWPASGTRTSNYGYRNIFGGTSFHGGIDIANSKGTNIYASDGGVVTHAGWMSGYGYLVIIDHLNGYTTYYAHNTKMLVSVGDKVHKGQHIAEMGATGRVTGVHCHFEIRLNGKQQNPRNYLP